MKLEHLTDQAQEHGNLIPIQGSTTEHDDLQRVVDQITKETGYIDLLVNNAGKSYHRLSGLVHTVLTVSKA